MIMFNNGELLGAYVRLILHYRKSVLTLIVGLIAFFAFKIGSLTVDMDPDIWSPQDHPYVKVTKAIERIFGGRNITIIGLVPKQGNIYQPAVLEKIRVIQRGIESIPTAIKHNVISLAATKVKSIQGMADGIEAAPMLETIPTTAEAMARLQAAVASNPVYIDTLVSQDSRAVAVLADFKVDKDNSSLAKLHAQINSIVDPQRDETVDIYMGGVPIQLAWFEHHMMYMPFFFGAALLVIMAIQYWSFRSLQGVFLPILTGLLSVIWGLGIMGWLGVHMDGMNTTTPVLIMAVAAGHAIQVLKRFYEEFNTLNKAGFGTTAQTANNQAIIYSLQRVGPIMIAAGLIASTSFLTLAFSKISVVQHFGVFAGTGILSAMILELTLIPVVRSLLGPPRQREIMREQHNGLVDRALSLLAEQFTTGHAGRVLGYGLLFIAVLAVGIIMLKTDNSLKRYNHPASVVRIDDASLNAHFAGTNSVFYYVQGKTQDVIKNPDVLRGIERLQVFLNQQPGVGKTQSIADFVKRMNQAVHGDDPAFYAIPDTPQAVAQILFLYQTSGNPEDFDSFVDNDYQRAVIWVYLKEDSTALSEALIAGSQPLIRTGFPADVNVAVGGSLPQTKAVDEVIMIEKFSNMVQMAIVVFLMASLLMRSLLAGIFVVLPLLLNVVANFGLLGWFGVPLDMGTAMIAAMAIGIGADYELYLLLRLKEELSKTSDINAAIRCSLLSSGKAVVFVALSIAGGYAVLLASNFAFYTRLAGMVIGTMLISAFSALILLRALMVLVKPKFAFARTEIERDVALRTTT